MLCLRCIKELLCSFRAGKGISELAARIRQLLACRLSLCLERVSSITQCRQLRLKLRDNTATAITHGPHFSSCGLQLRHQRRHFRSMRSPCRGRSSRGISSCFRRLSFDQCYRCFTLNSFLRPHTRLRGG